MQVRLVQVRTRKAGTRSERAELVETEVVGIGRGTDRTLSIPGLNVALEHAEIHVRGGQARILPVGGSEVLVNGRLVEGERALAPGDAVRIGHHEIRVVPPREREALCLEIEEVVKRGSEREELDRRTTREIESGLLSRRPLAWGLFLGVVGVFLAAPLAAKLFEGSWSSGTISRPHSFFANDCARCHQTGFVRVQDDTCLACHAGVGAHAPEATSPAELADTRCAACHQEHRGHAGLAALEERLCSDCHADLAGRFPDVKVADASDFGRQHPQFRLSLLDGGVEAPRREEWAPGLEERSGLVFNHLRHVGQAVKDTATGETRHMNCGECHRPDAGGGTMLPVVFEEHCQSCHALHFTEEDATRQAPHGDPVAVRRHVYEFFAGLALRGEVKDERAPVFLRRGRPGQPLSPEEQRAAYAWAEARKQDVEHAFFADEKGACRNCHAVQAGGAPDGGYAVAPVSVTQVWMPEIEFSHATHGPFACRDCHAAAAVYAPKGSETARPDWSVEAPGHPYALFDADELKRLRDLEPSEKAGDVLVPGIEECRSCHGGARAEPPLVASDCVLCHPFHKDELGPLRGPARTAWHPGQRALHAALPEPALRRAGSAR